MKVKIVYCRDVPELRKGSDYAAAFDLYAAEEFLNTKKGMLYEVPTGIKLEMPIGCCAIILERSSTFTRGLKLANTIGLIDSDYRGEIITKFVATDNGTIKKYDRIAQLLFLPTVNVMLETVTRLKVTKRNSKGFGSSGE